MTPTDHQSPELFRDPSQPHETLSQRRAMLAGIGGLAAGAILAGRANAGPLSPPAGPIDSTMKTLDQVEPRIPLNSTNTPGDADSMFHITQPGSYYLTASVFGISAQHGIKVSASGVTIDLCGFMLRGLGAIQGSFDGVFAENGTERVTVRNGHIEVMGRYGVNLGPMSTVENLTVRLSIATGVVLGDNSHAIGCRLTDNTFHGISASTGSIVQGCSAINNGIYGIFVTKGVIESCTASSNTSDGIRANSGTTVVACSAQLNGRDGISMQAGTATACVAQENQANGINASSTSAVTNCRGSSNGGSGIQISLGGTVSGCIASSNTDGGISSVSDGHLRDNTCDKNSVAGILITGSDNRIEGNHCTDNPIGLLIQSGGNLITKNTCAGNTNVNWSFSVNNHYGPISNRSTTSTGDVHGNASPSSLGVTDPHTNFTF